MKDNLLEASPEEIKKRQENADRAMEKLLEEEEMAAGAPAAASQKKKQAKTAKEHTESTGCRGARLEQKEGGTEGYGGRCGSRMPSTLPGRCPASC